MSTKRFADFAEERRPLDGEKIKIENVLNKEILVTGYRVKRSKFDKNTSGMVLTLQAEIDGETRVIFTGSDVLIEQLEKYGEQVPFLTTIKKIDRFFTLS